jgi:DNA-binding transcriptional ArsR family regulator
LPEPRDAQALISSLTTLPTGDFLRLAVTAGFTDPATPLTSNDLLALQGSPIAARVYVERYLRLNGRAQAHLLWIIEEPETARAELVDIIHRHVTDPFATVERSVRDECERASQRLAELLDGDRGAEPPWLRKMRDMQGFSPVVVAPSAFVSSSSAYYHEIPLPLFDGTSYEPYLRLVNTRSVLGATRSGRPAAGSPPRSQRSSTHDLIERSALLFGLLADLTRLRMVRLLANRPHYGQELASALGISGATTAHHTNELMRAGFVTIERRAHRTYFVLRTASLSSELRDSLTFLLATDQAALSNEQPDEKEPAL